jgi:nucleotidyltransferase substrate binding protein (TIGR01987 family)
MPTELLDLGPLTKVLGNVTVALESYAKDPVNDLIRDAVIQRFEYSYELSSKMLRRYLSLTERDKISIDTMPYAQLIRLASRRRLLNTDWEDWSKYREARNITSHTYDEKKANLIVEIVPEFLAAAEYLLKELQLKNVK